MKAIVIFIGINNKCWFKNGRFRYKTYNVTNISLEMMSDINVNIPAPLHINIPAPLHINIPAPLHINIPAPLHINIPAPLHINIPAPLHINIPAPLHGEVLVQAALLPKLQILLLIPTYGCRNAIVSLAQWSTAFNCIQLHSTAFNSSCIPALAGLSAWCSKVDRSTSALDEWCGLSYLYHYQYRRRSRTDFYSSITLSLRSKASDGIDFIRRALVHSMNSDLNGLILSRHSLAHDMISYQWHLRLQPLMHWED